MKIIFIVSAFPPQKSAIGEYVMFFSEQLCSKKHQIVILTKDNLESGVNGIFNVHTDKNISINNLPQKGIHVFAWISDWQKDLNRTIINIDNSFKSDYISFQYEPYSFQKRGMPLFLINCFNNISIDKLSVTFHEVYNRNYIWDKKIYFFYSLIQKYIAIQLYKNSVISFTSLDLYAKHFPKGKMRKLFIGSNIKTQQYNKNNATIAQSDSFFSLVGFGIKDYKPILEALQIVTKSEKICILFNIIGAFNEQEIAKIKNSICELNIEKSVLIHGYTDENKISSIFSHSHLYLDANYTDSDFRGGTTLKSGSLVAAFQSGLPILGYKGDMTDDYLEHGENVWFSENATPTIIAQNIIKLLGDIDLLGQLKIGSKKLYDDKLSWEVIGDSFIAMLEK